ncbi:uncharacterized protein LOC112348467 [Selaginella moellendorffii]|uniref:uncharacterized protein LOC112348467 n=1 Tax=Selaginella moellendorffii TaxID=88036 RepID=UPI000D1C77AA|nr:uncharacterized protein LOC112348467 [Selaginella moellendorffii]|eukprot:XP_024536805.1 uncharacterized protein LOC112348467 [Selaginella moellendorffii]
MYTRKKTRSSSSTGIDRNPAAKVSNTNSSSTRNPSLEQGYASKRSASLSGVTTDLRRTSLESKPSSTISTGVFKSAPPRPALGRPRDSRVRPKFDLRLNEPPPHSSMMEPDQPSPSASFKREATTPPFACETVPCKNPACHPGSSDFQAPVNDFFLQKSWIKGPSDPSGTVVSLSDRPSLCMSVHGSELAVGSSDHAIYTIDVGTCGLTRIMHGKSYGHTEWVTCLDHLPDGRIVSGGMDNKLCLWDKRGVRSRDLKGHTASVSGVKAGVFNQGSLAVSASYDRTLILWDLGGPSGREVAKLAGHKAPVMEFAGTPRGRLVSGCRDGTVILWDVDGRSPVLQCKNAHKGHVTALKAVEEEAGDVFLSGGQDGLLQVWDFRCRQPVHTACLHRSAKGVGALTCIAVAKNTTCGCPLVTTAGADRVLKVLDVRASFNAVFTLEDHRDFIYSLYMNGSLAWSGGGDGSLLVHDVERGKCLYGLGAIKNGAVRGISLAGDAQEKLVVTGDDGNVMLYSL